MDNFITVFCNVSYFVREMGTGRFVYPSFKMQFFRQLVPLVEYIILRDYGIVNIGSPTSKVEFNWLITDELNCQQLGTIGGSEEGWERGVIHRWDRIRQINLVMGQRIARRKWQRQLVAAGQYPIIRLSFAALSSLFHRHTASLLQINQMWCRMTRILPLGTHNTSSRTAVGK